MFFVRPAGVIIFYYYILCPSVRAVRGQLKKFRFVSTRRARIGIINYPRAAGTVSRSNRTVTCNDGGVTVKRDQLRVQGPRGSRISRWCFSTKKKKILTLFGFLEFFIVDLLPVKY